MEQEQSYSALAESGTGISSSGTTANTCTQVCPDPSDEPDTSEIPQLDLDVINQQRTSDNQTATLTANRAKAAAAAVKDAAQAIWQQEDKKKDAAKLEAGYTKQAARDAAELTYTTGLRDADKPHSKRTIRLLEEQRCEAFRNAEIDYAKACHAAELAWLGAKGTWDAAQVAHTQAVEIADKTEALETTKASIKYYEALGQFLKC